MNKTYTVLACVWLGSACGEDRGAVDSDVAVDSDDLAVDADDVAVDSDDVAADADAAGPALQAAIDAFCPRYAALYCERAGDCGCGAAPGFPDDVGCRAHFEAQCAEGLAGFLPFVVSGEARYRPEVVDECLAFFAPIFGACLGVPSEMFYVGCPIIEPAGGPGPLPGEGEACESTCRAGLRCNGHCHGPVALGSPCESPYDCSVDQVCAAGECAAPDFADRGESCAPGGCAGDDACLASARKRCVARVSGAACANDDDCPGDEHCQDQRCVALPGDGDACASGVRCGDGLGCLGGTCAALPEAGDPCADGEHGPMCAAGLACHDDGTCGAIPGEGQTCGVGAVACGDGLGCAFGPEGSTCIVPLGDGAECQNDATCAAGFFCDYDEGRCRAARALGAGCRNGNECGRGVCLPDAAFIFRCAPRPAVDEACFLDECAADAVCRTPYAEGACVPAALCGVVHF